MRSWSSPTGNADADIVAADLLAQSEHDKEAKGIVVTTDEAFGQAVIEAVEAQLQQLDTREIASKSWADFGEVLLADDLEEAIAYANSYAPEHLEANVAETQQEQTVEALHNYGSLFIGGNTAEVFGDYASGTNHTLRLWVQRVTREAYGRHVPQDLHLSEHEPGSHDEYRTAGVQFGQRRGTDRSCQSSRNPDGKKRKIV